MEFDLWTRVGMVALVVGVYLVPLLCIVGVGYALAWAWKWTSQAPTGRKGR